MRIKYSLKQSLIAYFLLIAILPIMITSIFLNNIIVDYMIKDIEESNKTLSNFVISQTHTYFTKASDFLYLVGYMLSEDEIIHDHNTNLLLEELLANQNYFEAIEVLDENYIVTEIAPYNESYIGISFKDQPYLNSNINDEFDSWSSTFNSVYTNNSTISYIIKLKDNRYLVGYLNLANIREINDIINDDSINISILDDKGIYIADNNTGLVSQRAYNPKFDFFKNNLTKGNKFLETPYLEGRAYISIDEIPDTNWIVLAIQSDDATTAVTRDIGFLFVLIFIGIFILVTFLAVLSSKQIIMPVVQLNDKLSEIIDGDYTQPIIYNGYKELQNLILEFNKMIEILKSRDHNIRHLAYFDSLTNLPNRTQLNQHLELIIAKKETPFFGLIYLDIDNFKNINDTLGHAFGDHLLIQLSLELQKHISPNDMLSRYGGDEFVIYLKRNTRELLWQDTKAFYDAIKRTITIDNLNIDITMSAGFAIYPDHASSRDELIKAVDMANNYSKDNGKNQLTLFSYEILDVFTKRIRLENDLKEALKNDEFRLYYQPQFFSHNNALRGAEALIRWAHPSGEIIPPNVFIPIAEDLGIIHDIGKWVLKEACSQMKEWHNLFENNYIIAINISPVQLLAETFVEETLSIIKDSGIDIDKVELEITENVLIHSLDRTFKTIDQLSQFGIKFSLDDFGMEYSSLNYLGTLDINVLKIDKAFVSSIRKDQRRTKILDAIIRLSHQLGLKIIAEGVETQEQIDYLVSKKCDILQGYYFSKPVPKAEFENYFKKRG